MFDLSLALKKRENVIALIAGVIFFIFLFFATSYFANWELKVQAKQKVDEIYKNIREKAHANLEQAMILANTPGVLEAYKLAESGDLSDKNSEKSAEARNKLRNIFAGYMEQVRKTLKYTPKIHFHLPPARSLVRLWRDVQTPKGDISDNLSGFRFTILDMNKDSAHKYIAGIEIGRGGFALRGIAPIFDEERKVGSVEVLSSFTKFYNQIKASKKEELALYMNKPYLKVAKKLKDKERYPHIGEFVSVSRTSPKIISEVISADLLEQAKEKIIIKNLGRREIVLFPIKDFQQKQIGVGVYVLDISDIFKAIWMMRLACLLGILVFIGIVFWLTWSMEQLHQKNEEELDRRRVELETKINEIVQSLDQNYKEVHDVIMALDNSSEQLSSTSTRQASATEEAVAAMEEISSMIKQTNEYGNETTNLAMTSTAQVEQGVEVMKRLEQAMQEIDATKTELSNILDLINKITEKTKIINNIVVKTELLSFNASIEAARAAEYGKGFSVVAEEIGNLARLSGQSAKDIEKLLGEGITKVGASIETIESKINQGEMVVNECMAVFNEIKEVSVKLSSNIDSISQATNEQTKGVEQTTLAMNEISKSTQNNLKVTMTTSELSKKVQEQLDLLRSSIEKLKQVH